VHGILHLLGYDHEKSEQEADKMEKKSDEILKLIKS
jgi:probable rRNA maturation factor